MVTNSHNVLDFGLYFFLEHFLSENWSYLVFCQSDNAFELRTVPDRFFICQRKRSRINSLLSFHFFSVEKRFSNDINV